MLLGRLDEADLAIFREAWIGYEASDVMGVDEAKRAIRHYVEVMADLVERYEIEDEDDYTIDPATGRISTG